MAAVQLVAGNTHTFEVDFRVPDTDGELRDPTTVTFYRLEKYKATPPETFVFGADDEVEKVSVGVFKLTLSFDEPGTFSVGAQGTGACHAYEDVDVVVAPATAKGQ